MQEYIKSGKTIVGTLQLDCVYATNVDKQN